MMMNSTYRDDHFLRAKERTAVNWAATRMANWTDFPLDPCFVAYIIDMYAFKEGRVPRCDAGTLKLIKIQYLVKTANTKRFPLLCVLQKE